MRTYLIVPEDGVQMAQQRVGERHWCTIPHSSLSSTGVVKSVDDLILGDIWHYQPVCNIRLYKFDIVVVDVWNSSATVFTDFPDSRYPIKLNHAFSTNSVSHSKIKSLCKFDLLFPLCGKAFTHQWQIEHFCNFYFCTLEEKNECGQSCVKCITMFSLTGWKRIKFPLIWYIIYWILLQFCMKNLNLKKCLLSFFAECIRYMYRHIL